MRPEYIAGGAMGRSSKILIVVLAGTYAAFLFWYGGYGRPLTPEQKKARSARLEAYRRGKAA